VLDLKFSGIFAGAAFVLSLLIGLISRSTMPMLIVRPLIFAVIFFALSAVIKILVSSKLPELLEGSAGGDSPRPGSRINILEDDGASDSSAMTEGFISGALGQASMGARPDDSEDNLGDISELSRRISSLHSSGEDTTAEEGIAGIDQNEKESYTDNGGSGGSVVPDFSNMFSAGSSSIEGGPPAGGQARAAGASAGSKKNIGLDSDEGLPDLDSMAEAFMSGSPGDEGANERSSPGPSRRSDKTPKWTEDFDAKEIAMGIRSVLKKDKEG
jgi:hypothetical protein